MKLKNSIERIDLKSMALFTVVSAAVLTGIRTYQMFTIVERGSGFWTGRNFTINLLYILLFLVIGVSVFLGFSSSKIPHSFSKKKDPIIGAGALILAFSMVIDGATQLWNFINVLTDWKNYAPTEMNRLDFLVKSSSFALPLETVFAILGALYFLLFGLYYLNGSRSPDDFKLLAVMPVFWLLMQLVYRFARTTNFMNVSELFFELFLLAAMILFFLNFSRIISHVGEKDSYWTVYAFGIPSVVLGFICSVPRFLLVVTGKGAMLTDNSPFTFWYLAAALFIALCLFRLFNEEEETSVSESALLAEGEEATLEETASEETKPEPEANVAESPAPKAQAPKVEKFNAAEFFGNAIKKNEEKSADEATPDEKEEKAKRSPKVEAPKVEKFSMEALENNEPTHEYIHEEPAELSEKEVEESPAEFAAVSDEPKEVPADAADISAEQPPVSEPEDDDGRLDLNNLIRSATGDNKADKEEKLELDRFNLEEFLRKLEEEQNKK